MNDSDRLIPLSVVRSILTAEMIGEGVHTALRKYCDHGMTAHRAIRDMPDDDWHRAMVGVAADLLAYLEAGGDQDEPTCSTCDAECSGH